MTVATDRRTAARAIIKEWVTVQIAQNRDPDMYLDSLGGDEIALWRGGGFLYNEKRIFISETGYLVVWDSYRRSRIEEYFIFGRYFEWTESWWTVSLEDDDSDEDEHCPDLVGTEVSTKNLLTIGTYLASL